MNPEPRNPTYRETLFLIFLGYRKQKNQLKRCLLFIKEFFEPSPRRDALIKLHETIIQDIEKNEREIQLRSELTRVRGRF